ncbi:hypothetical protein N9424_04570 [Gammaproteobacteria bacterium]|jgi:hypothetical protein|nr:hypothetical protein [Gammaproteobacteria bacterium]|tara:strand:- start:475 stop:1653 length:1179 start_codon:yes stop_codon:yes gene_type:complete
MLKKITPLLTLLLIISCSTTSPITTMSYEELEIEGTYLSNKLDINIVEFDPGLSDNDDKSRELGVWPELRRAEARRFPVKLASSLNESNAFAAISVTTNASYLSDIVITGKIIQSNGEDVHISITAIDSTGNKIINKKIYKHRASEYFYQNIRNKDLDPFDPIYRAIAADLIIKLKARSLNEIELVTDLRFAKNLNEEYFYDSLEYSDNKYELGFIPSSNDPMFLRSQNVQLKDLAFRNEMQKYYINFSDDMDESYRIWQQAALTASKSKREAEAQAAARALMGAILIAAVASSAGDDDYYDYDYGAIAAATVGAGLLVSAVGNMQEAKVHEGTINEISQSYDGEIAPKVVEMEGLQVKLEGNIEDQFNQWQMVLGDIYESESSQTKEFEIL